ncbi:hypothetical protein ACOSQ2_020852 [Xanthoceras sorbifolium]
MITAASAMKINASISVYISKAMAKILKGSTKRSVIARLLVLRVEGRYYWAGNGDFAMITAASAMKISTSISVDVAKATTKILQGSMKRLVIARLLVLLGI